MGEKYDPLPDEKENPEGYWNEVIKVNKFNIKGEEGNIDKFKAGIDMLQEKLGEVNEQIDLEREETLILQKLYPEHGEEYVEAKEWKDYMHKKFKFMLVVNKRRKKAHETAHRMQLKASQQSISQSEENIKQYKKEVSDAKHKKEAAMKDMQSMTG